MPTFGSTAITTFAHALVGVTGNQVTIEVHGTEARTDGSTIVLPNQGVWQEVDFQVLCGVTCHEISHVWFRSIQALTTALSDYQPQQLDRARRCFNALADVADETRFIKALPAAAGLFASASIALLEAARRDGAFPIRPPEQLSEHHLLATGINWVRSIPGSRTRRLLRGWRTKVAGLNAVCKILTRAQDHTPRKRFTPTRTPAQWQRFNRLVRELFDLMERLYPPQAQSPEASEGNAGDALQTWRKRVMDGACAAATQAQQSGVKADVEDWRDAVVPPSQAGQPPISGDEACYQRLLPAFRRTAQKLARRPTISFEDGHRLGKRLNRPHRAYLDGRCFRRAQLEEGCEVAVALVLDHSGSMEAHLPIFLPVVRALADALDALPGVALAVWRYGSAVERLTNNKDLQNGPLMGGTATHLALAEVAGWCRTRPERRKALLLFTDGEPDRQAETLQQAIELRRSGVSLLVGSIGLGRERCARSLPGAVFDVDPNFVACSLQLALDHIRREAGV